MGEGLGQLGGAEAWLGPVVGKTRRKKPEVEKSLSGRKWECLQWRRVGGVAGSQRLHGCRVGVKAQLMGRSQQWGD